MAVAERKRPWYLVVALLATLALGTIHACHGWAEIAEYREGINADLYTSDIAQEDDRAAVASRVEAYIRAFDAAQPRGYPLAVAELLLGGVIVFFSIRAMGGSNGARAALVQLVVAQAALGVASFWLLRDVDGALMRMVDAKTSVVMRDQIRQANIHDAQMAEEVARFEERMTHAFLPTLTAIQAIGGLLVVVALTRRRSRDFFDAAAAALEER
jgi:hypothetical protein